MRRTIAVFAAFAALLLAAGCSGDNAKKSAAKGAAEAKEPAAAVLTSAKPEGEKAPESAEAAVVHRDVDMETLDVEPLSALKLVALMKTGWNLGNTLDATGPYASGLATETCWGQPKTTKAMIDALKAAGFRTIRIPVSWNQHVSQDGKYMIDAAWLARVKEIVDWAYSQKMFVIINSHHDCYETNSAIPGGQPFYYPSRENKEASAAYLKALWTQIAAAFADYDNHLVFETMNEPRLRGTNYEWWYDANSEQCHEARDVLNELNELVLKTIRSVKGNEKRLVMVPGLQASPDSAFAEGFKVPDDPAKMVAVSVHMYSPYDFAMKSPGDRQFTAVHKSSLMQYFNKLNEQFISKGIPVVIGEYGATNKENLEAREEWFEYFIASSRKFGMPACLWDNGVWKVEGTAANRYDEHFGFYNRNAQTWFFPTLIDKIMENCE